jgi:type IV pilus assembly protein PilQ
MKANERVRGLVLGFWSFLISGFLLGMTGERVCGQDVPAAMPLVQGTNVNLVTINVDNGPVTQVLNAFSRQTGRSIVIGPEVTGNITLRVTNIPWQEALDVILKPYGYGYYLVGDTIIICGLDKLPKSIVGGTQSVAAASAAVPAPRPAEPLIVRVMTLKYLDASDVDELIRNQLSPSGKLGKLLIRSQSWQDQQIYQGNMNTTSSESLGRLKRLTEESAQVRGKTLVVVDTQEVIDRVQAIIDKVDVAPIQIQIEAKFVEIRADLLRDIGVEWGSGLNGAASPGSYQNIGTKGAGGLFAAGGQQISGAAKPASFSTPSGLSAKSPFDGGLTLAFQKLTDLQFEVLLHLLQEDGSYNMLSAPSVLTMNNQDAVIIVGQKLPIIKSDSSGGLGTTTISTSLERYEDIGIKLKVMPQVCDHEQINLIVHPSVRELLGYQSGKVGTSADATTGGSVSLTEYPVVATREAETHVLVKSGQTIVIGGMLRDKKQTTQIKVPFLGSIPLIGMLFRRETVNTEKIELLIFLTATIRNTTEEMAVVAPDVKSMIKVEKVNAPAKP